MNVGNGMNMDLILTFEEIFPEEKVLKPEEYLKGGSKEKILLVASFFLGFKPSKSRYHDITELLKMLFSRENDDLAIKIFNRIQSIQNTGKDIVIINTFTSLKLFEHFFERFDDSVSQGPVEFERSIFKAYLALNSELINSQKISLSSTEDLKLPEKISIMLFCQDYPISDTKNYDIVETWVTQVSKAIYLFEYLESNPKTKPLLIEFLKYFDSSDWKEYLKHLLPLTIPAVANKREAHTDINVPGGEDFKNSCDFIEKLIVEPINKLDEYDFLSLRARPFYKVGEGVYRIIFNLFVVEKIYKGLYFLLRDANEKLLDGQKIPNFRSFYCSDFSEKNLLYRTIKMINPTKCIKFTGQELADCNIKGAPDFYLRKGKNILLFESKDVLIGKEVKTSFDYHLYEKEFKKRFYYKELPNGREKPEAVLQLINFIRRLLKKEFSKDIAYNYRDVFIYPILITHDIGFDTPGFNQIINMWFQNEIWNLEEEGLFIHRIKPLTVININTLIYYQVGLVQDIPLHKIIDEYIVHNEFKLRSAFQSLEEYKQQHLEKLMPFSVFLDRHFFKLGIHKPPPIMDIVGEAIFNEVWRNKSQS